MTPKIVIFGVNGMLGRTLLMYLSKFYNVIGYSRQDFDAHNLSNLNTLAKSWDKNTIVINAIGIIPQKYSLINQSSAFIKINSIFPHVLQQVTFTSNSTLIHITTDCVFDGKDGPYTEQSPHTEMNIYGLSKSCGEPTDAMIIRTSIIGEEIVGKKSLLEWVRSQRNKTIQGFTQHYWNGLTCLQVGKVIHHCLQNNIKWQGVRHIVSPEIVSKYELVNMINNVYELNIHIEPKETEKVNKALISTIKFDIPPLFKQIQEQKSFFEENLT